MGYVVLMNGERFARFDDRADADAYVRVQQRKMRGAGIARGVPDEKDRAFAAKQQWRVEAE